MKIRTLLTVLSLATLATAAQAQWTASQPATIAADAGAAVSATFTLVASSHPTGTYTVATPVVVWQGTAPAAVTPAVSDSTIDIYTYPPYGNLVANDEPVVVSVDFTVPAGAASGTTYLGTVYEPLTGTRAAEQNVVGTIAVSVN